MIHMGDDYSRMECPESSLPKFSPQEVEDFKTERMDMPNRIEAGIATDEEVEKYMQNDIDFINETYEAV